MSEEDKKRRAGKSGTPGQPTLVELLEDGDGRALRQLTLRLSEEEIGVDFRHRAARQLSRRSGRFWALLLGQDPPRLESVREALWPL